MQNCSIKIPVLIFSLFLVLSRYNIFYEWSVLYKLTIISLFFLKFSKNEESKIFLSEEYNKYNLSKILILKKKINTIYLEIFIFLLGHAQFMLTDIHYGIKKKILFIFVKNIVV